MVGIRGKIVKELLYKIEINMDTAAVDNSVAVFSEFIKALVLEADMLNPDAEVDESAKQQAEEASDAHMRDLSILFQLSGDHQKEVDEIFARMASSSAKKASSAISATNASNEQLLDIIKAARKYVKQANLAAKAKHDTPGIFYQDGSVYSTMEETKDLLSRIDATVNEG